MWYEKKLQRWAYKCAPIYCLKLDNVDTCNKLISAEIAILQEFLNQSLGLQYRFNIVFFFVMCLSFAWKEKDRDHEKFFFSFSFKIPYWKCAVPKGRWAWPRSEPSFYVWPEMITWLRCPHFLELKSDSDAKREIREINIHKVYRFYNLCLAWNDYLDEMPLIS